MNIKCSRETFLTVVILQLLGVVCLTFFLLENIKIFLSESELEALRELKIFMNDWCQVREARTNVKTILGPCHDQLKWTYDRNGTLTTGSKSFVSYWDLQPAGKFSRFFIQAVSSHGNLKTNGGDWWRVFIRSPHASLKPIVFDLGNGTYEVVCLIVDPGTYNVEITLDFTLCDGFRDPPEDWFIIGNTHGKNQPRGTLRGRAEADYLLQPLQEGKKITIYIKPPNGRGLFPFNNLPKNVLAKLEKNCDFSCGMKCKLMWDGYGRWEGDTWKPFLKAKEVNQIDRVNKSSEPLFNTLWIYGDSQAQYMYNEIQGTPLCGTIFKTCKLTHNWVYRYTGDRVATDDLDFNQTRVLHELKGVLDDPEMTENSVIVLNLGYHYLQTISFSKYTKLLPEIEKMFRTREREKQNIPRLIWKTTMSLNKEKDAREMLYHDLKRFLSNPRIAMFNAYATSLMCREGFEIIDVHPLTASYPGGSGGPNVGYWKNNDIVHFKPIVMKPFEDVFTEYISENLPQELTFENYQLS